jgi:glycosyltransferase involved in cell wall biosynthesis
MASLPLIAFATTHWNSLWMNRQHLLSRLAAGGRPVAYSNGVVHYSRLGEVHWRQTASVQDRVVVMREGYFLPATHRPTPLRRLALRHHCARIRAALGIDDGAPVIGMCFDPDLLDCIDALAPAVRVFHIYDSYNKMGNGCAAFEEVRRRIRAFDLVTASSAYMYEDVVGSRPEARFIVPNGVDFAALAAPPAVASGTADAIRRLPGPKIGYVGSINTKIHFELVHALASALPEASFVFVGPVRTAMLQRQPEDFVAYERLGRLANVHFFGPVARPELAAVIGAMDVNCIFFRIDRPDWVSAVYPIKLNEYLAVGKPVISTAVKVVREEFAHVVTVCDTVEEWLAALRPMLDGRRDDAGSEARRQVARANDWSQRVSHIESLLDALAV